MVQFEEVYEELKGRTGTDPDIEQELCRRVAEIESEDGVVESLQKIDWIMVVILIILGTIVPIIYYAAKYGISG